MKEVSREFFFDGMVLPSSVYLKVSSGNYLMIGKKGDKSNFSNLHAYKNPDALIAVEAQEYPELIRFVTNLTQKFVSVQSVPDAVKMKFLTGLTQDAMSTLESSGFASVEKIEAVSNLLIQMSQTISNFSAILDIVRNLGDAEAKHSMTTCLISMLLCEEMRVHLTAAQEKVAMGSLLHDAGLKFVPQEILERPRHLWSSDDMKTFEQHPLKGAEALRNMKDISTDVLLIIAEHHENAHGTGYPKKLRDIKISPLARIVSLADYYAELLLSAENGGKNYTPDEAVHYIETVMGQPFNKQVFASLKNINNKKFLNGKTG